MDEQNSSGNKIYLWILGFIVLLLLIFGVFYLIRLSHNSSKPDYSTTFCNAVIKNDVSIFQNYLIITNQTDSDGSTGSEIALYNLVNMLYYKNLSAMQAAYDSTGSQMYLSMMGLVNGSISFSSQLCSQMTGLNGDQLKDCNLLISMYGAFENKDVNVCKNILDSPELGKVCSKLIQGCN